MTWRFQRSRGARECRVGIVVFVLVDVMAELSLFPSSCASQVLRRVVPPYYFLCNKVDDPIFERSYPDQHLVPYAS